MSKVIMFFVITMEGTYLHYESVNNNIFYTPIRTDSLTHTLARVCVCVSVLCNTKPRMYKSMYFRLSALFK